MKGVKVKKLKGSTIFKNLQSIVIITAIALLIFAPQAISQAQDMEDKNIDSKMQAEIIDSIAQALNEVYVFPDVAKKMEKYLRSQYKSKKYADLTGMRSFTKKLTEDLEEISKDKHLGVHFVSDKTIAEKVKNDTLTDDAKREQLEEARRDNFGFKEVKILEGNVGYVDFRFFAEAENAGMTAIAAMNFLAYTDAIIFDIRQNGGGNPSMIQLISSYLFDESVHLNDFYVRKSDSYHQFWTPDHVQGPRLSHVDVYVLTSSRTFSGAEEFAYNIKNMKRGTLVGETTGGGAHPIERRLFSNLNCYMSLPFGRAVNPISGTNWEGTGVAPDIETPQDQALDMAHLEALKKLKEKTTDEDRLALLQWVIDGKNVRLHPVEIEVSQLQKYVGVFGPRTVTLENGCLYYERENRPKYKLIPMGNDIFMLDGLDYFRLSFKPNAEGKYDEVVGLYDDGHSDRNPRTK
jgi:hypothetical protein